MNKKRWFAMLLAAAMILSILPVSAFAAENQKSGVCMEEQIQNPEMHEEYPPEAAEESQVSQSQEETREELIPGIGENPAPENQEDFQESQYPAVGEGEEFPEQPARSEEEIREEELPCDEEIAEKEPDETLQEGPIRELTMVLEGSSQEEDQLPDDAGAGDRVAMVDGTYYSTLASAVESVLNSEGKSGTVTLLADASGSGIGLFNGKGAKGVNLTIDFGGYTYTCADPAVGSSGTESQGFHLEAGNTVTLKNGTIRVSDTSTKTKMLIQNYCDLTLQDLSLEGSSITQYILSCNYGNISLERVNISGTHPGLVGIDLMHWIGFYPAAPTMTIQNTKDNIIRGSIDVYCYQSGTGVIPDCQEPATMTILGGQFDADPTPYVPEGYQVTGEGPYLVSLIPVSTPTPAPTPAPDQSQEEKPSAPVSTPVVTPSPEPQATQRPVTQVRPTPTATPYQTQNTPVQVTTVAQAQVSENTAVVTLEKETFVQAVDKAVDNGKANGVSPTVTVEVTQDQEAKAVQITLPVQALEKLSREEGAALTLTSQVVQVTFDAPALAAIAQQAGEEVRLVVTPVEQDDMTPAQASVVGEYPAFELALHSGDTVISSFREGSAAVTLPYTLAEGQQAQGIVVWYLEEDGTVTPCQTTYDPQAEQVTFITPHFSRYVIGYDETLLPQQEALQQGQEEKSPALEPVSALSLPMVAGIAVAAAAVLAFVGWKFLLHRN